MEHIEVFLKGVTLTILLLTSIRYFKNDEVVTKVVGRIMLMWIAIVSVSLLKFVPGFDEWGLPKHLFSMLDVFLLPTFAFVTIALTNVKSLNALTILLHEVPFLLIALIYAFTDMNACYIVGVVYGILYSLGVFVYALMTISKYNSKIKEYYSDNDFRKLDWLSKLYWVLLFFIFVCGITIFAQSELFPIAGSIVTIIFWLFFDFNITKQHFISLQNIIDNAKNEEKNNKEKDFAENVITLQKSVDELRQLVNPYDYDHKKLANKGKAEEKDVVERKETGNNKSVETKKEVEKITETISEPAKTNNTTVHDDASNNEKTEQTDVNLPKKIEDLEIKDLSEDKLQEIMDGLEHQQIETPKTQVSSETKDVIDLEGQTNQYPFVQELNRLCKEERIFLTPGLSIQDVVEKLGTNRTYLSNYLNKELNITFYDFINEQRLDYAAMLLASTKINIEQIIYECGFQSKTTFHRVFANKFGCTPKQYRDRQ